MGMIPITVISLLVLTGYDNPLTKEIDEGAIGTYIDNPLTREIDEGAIGTGIDNPLTKEIDEGAIEGD